jgi:hypothetical protein
MLPDVYAGFPEIDQLRIENGEPVLNFGPLSDHDAKLDDAIA